MPNPWISPKNSMDWMCNPWIGRVARGLGVVGSERIVYTKKPQITSGNKESKVIPLFSLAFAGGYFRKISIRNIDWEEGGSYQSPSSLSFCPCAPLQGSIYQEQLQPGHSSKLATTFFIKNRLVRFATALKSYFIFDSLFPF